MDAVPSVDAAPTVDPAPSVDTVPSVDAVPSDDAVPSIDAVLVRRLLAAQFPQWADLPIAAVELQGWDNRTFRLGDRLSVRLPSAAGYRLQVGKEHLWLPRLAPGLPLPIPVPVARGAPALGYPFEWSVYEWLEGAPPDADAAKGTEAVAIAASLARFVLALQDIDTAGGPAPGPHNGWRGGPLMTYDNDTRRSLDRVGDLVDGDGARRVWAAALTATWAGPASWFHGDVAAANLLLRDGRLAAVIDFGSCGVGDPACDLTVAWTLFAGPSRDAFREAMSRSSVLTDSAWARARGWALWKALITVAAHPGTVRAALSLRVIRDVIAEVDTSPSGVP